MLRMNNFLRGVASIFGSFTIPHRRQRRKIVLNKDFWLEDGKAIYSDWKEVGDCLRKAMGIK